MGDISFIYIYLVPVLLEGARLMLVVRVWMELKKESFFTKEINWKGFSSWKAKCVIMWRKQGVFPKCHIQISPNLKFVSCKYSSGYTVYSYYRSSKENGLRGKSFQARCIHESKLDRLREGRGFPVLISRNGSPQLTSFDRRRRDDVGIQHE